MLYPRQQAIERINALSGVQVPFFFFTDFLGTKAWICELSTIDPGELSFSFPKLHNYGKQNGGKGRLDPSPKSLADFTNQFDKVVSEINYGNSFLVNLTHRTPIHTNITLAEIAQRSHAKYTIRYKNDFVCFSPETFVQIINNQIQSFPMKGTVDASRPNAREMLLASQKEMAEHITITDLIRNDLSQVAHDVHVTSFRHIDELVTNRKALLQMSSTITGTLDIDWKCRLGHILFTLLPAGSISGAPKAKTLDIIQTVEDYERGFYTGIAGVFDGEVLDSCVMIRFIEQEKYQMVYKSGGGITSFSDCQSEYQEFIDKIYVPVY